MKRICLPLTLLVFLFVSSAVIATAADVTAVQRAIAKKGAAWTAGETALSDLSPEAFARYCNWEFAEPPNQVLWSEETKLSKDTPNHIDWRDIDGENFVTPIKDQHPCGTCATFSSIAVFEAMIKIVVDNSFVEPDLSEEHVYACEGPVPYTFFHPMIYLKGSGAPDETCMPYDCQFTGDRPPCNETCSDWEARAMKTTDYRFFMWPQPEALIEALQDGPIIAGMQVYEDFQTYTGGIYEHVTGGILGGHGVALIGYNRAEQYWIIKNSWGTEWGEAGFAKMRWETGMLRFGYQSVDISVDYETICGANTAPMIDDLELPDATLDLPEDADLDFTFNYADLEANLRGGELFISLDGGDAFRYEEPLRELIGTSEAAREDIAVFTVAGPFVPGDHTLQIVVNDICGAQSNEITVPFTVAGEIPSDDDDDDSDSPADDDDDNDDQATDDDDDDDGGCGC